jgi:hypothetical protein
MQSKRWSAGAGWQNATAGNPIDLPPPLPPGCQDEVSTENSASQVHASAEDASAMGFNVQNAFNFMDFPMRIPSIGMENIFRRPAAVSQNQMQTNPDSEFAGIACFLFSSRLPIFRPW